MVNKKHRKPNSELLISEGVTLKDPSLWSFIWRFFLWTIFLAIIIGYMVFTFKINFDSESLIKWKPTIVQGIMAISFLVISLLYKYNKIRPLFSGNLKIYHHHWYLMNFIVMIACAVYSCLNIYIASNFSTLFWVDFQFFGRIGIWVIAIIAGVMISKLPTKT